jgi:dihydroflavonol-4-reductase
MKVLITGATGFLGSHLCRRMVAEGHEVRALCRPASDLATLAGFPLERVVGDVTDFESVRRAVRGREWVVHAAAVLNESSQAPDQQWKVNVEGSRNVAQACRKEGAARLLHVSSVAAIGIPADPEHPANEDSPFNLENTRLNYHRSKRRAEEEVLAEAGRGLDVVVVNPAGMFGPSGARYRSGEVIWKVRRSAIVPYLTGGTCVVHVEDVLDGILAALARGAKGERYILGGENITYRAMVETAAQAMHLRRRFVPLPALVTGLAAIVFEAWDRVRGRPTRTSRVGHFLASRHLFYDSSKARKALGYSPRDFRAILDDCLQWEASRSGALVPVGLRGEIS